MKYTIELTSHGCSVAMVNANTDGIGSLKSKGVVFYDDMGFAYWVVRYLNEYVYDQRLGTQIQRFRRYLNTASAVSVTTQTKRQTETSISKIIAGKVLDDLSLKNDVIKYMQSVVHFLFEDYVEKKYRDEFKVEETPSVALDSILYFQIGRLDLNKVKIIYTTPAKMVMIQPDFDAKTLVVIASTGLTCDETTKISQFYQLKMREGESGTGSDK